MHYTFPFIKQSDFKKASRINVLNFGRKFQQALKLNNLFKALKYPLKYSIKHD